MIASWKARGNPAIGPKRFSSATETSAIALAVKPANKAFYFIATAADGEKRSLERTIEGFRGFLYCLEGAQEKGIVYGSGAWKKGDIKESPALNEAYEMGRHV